MNKYHFRINNSVKYNNAGSKAVDDCRKIMLMRGYTDIEIHFNKSLFLLPYNFIKLVFYLFLYLFLIKKKSLIVVQYPLLGINGIFKYYAKLLKLKRCKLACIIHDLEAIRTEEKKNSREVDALSAYDAVIAHNAAMKEWLVKNGYKGFITEIILFDYLLNNNETKAKEKFKEYNSKKAVIAFAGNLGTLGKSSFLSKLSADKIGFNLHLYGPGYNGNFSDEEKIDWCGSFSPNQIVNELGGDFGLIWDGDSQDDITGLMGQYLKYNTPHKTSLYIVSGLPVIISKKAAMANFVREMNVGICIDNISSISEEANKITNECYKQMRRNVKSVADKLKKGSYFKEAIIKIENFYANKDI